MKSIISTFAILFFFIIYTNAQEEIYIYKDGVVKYTQLVSEIDSIIFKTSTNSQTVTDIDGNIYHTITIGNKTWMVENLKTTKYANGDPITHMIDNYNWSQLNYGAYCNFEHSLDNKNAFGCLYNWFAVHDSRKLAPSGWHVATNQDWEDLLIYVASHIGTSGSIGKALATKDLWNPVSSTTATTAIGKEPIRNNSSGFTAYPSGKRGYTGAFDSYGEKCFWWVYDTTASSSQPNCRWLANYGDNLYDWELSILVSRQCGLSVRCVKD